MDTNPAHPSIHKRKICFPNGNLAQAIVALPGTSANALVDALAIPRPKAVMLITGGADHLDDRLQPDLLQVFTHGLAHIAATLEALIIDGGTQAGVMALIGQGVAQQPHRPALLGVSPAGAVTYPGWPAHLSNSKQVPLDPNHSYFVLVETDKWGGETATMYELANVLSRLCPSVAILINGGAIAKNEMLYNVRQKRPIIVLEESGRLADEIVSVWRKKAISPSDPDLAEIIMQGNLHLFPLTHPFWELEQLTQRLLSNE